MRQHLGWLSFFSAILWVMPAAHGQTALRPQESIKSYGGWQAADSPQQRAYFQSPDYPSLRAPDYPSLHAPDGQNLPPASGFGGASLPTPPALSSPVLPATAAYNPFSNPGGSFPPTDVTQASELRDSSRPPNQAPQQAIYPPQTYPQQTYPPQAYPQQTSPAQNYPPPTYPPQRTSQPNYPQPTASGGNVQGYPQGQASLRNVSGAGPNSAVYSNGASPPLQPVVSNDPRFVSPAPAPRLGNFATSPYQSSPFRMAAYQAGQVPVYPPGTASPLAANVQPTLIPNASTLPQYQPTVGVYPTNYQCVPQIAPGAIAPPTLPPNLAPQMYTPDNSGYRPLFSLGQENYNVLLGRGIIGQPTVYVPGQPIRNFIRYVSP